MVATTSSTPKVKKSDYRRIADELRHQILTGKLAVGVQLPSTPKLATTWETSYGTIHNALRSLVREGWLERIHGAGTYVAERKTRFSCTGIFHIYDVGSNEHSSGAYSRSMQSALVKQLATVGKESLIFIDHRPHGERETVLPALAEAILNRRIQCVIVPSSEESGSAALARLSVPTAFLFNAHSTNWIDFSSENFFGEGLHRLAAQGGQSVGLITNVACDENDAEGFHRAVREAGMATTGAWTRRPRRYSSEFAAHGYHEFHRLWRQAKRPDGLMVFPDTVVNGVVTAILEIGYREVTSQMKFVFHRNTHLGFLCPFPVTWAVSSEEVLARGLIQMIQKQFDGEKITPVRLAYDFRENEPYILKP